MPAALAIAFVVVGVAAPPAQTPRQPGTKASALRGVRLEDVAWTDVVPLLTEQSVVVIPLGAAAAAHGPHLRLRNDLTLAEYLGGRILASSDVVVAPTLTHHYYPALADYSGSTSIPAETARDLTIAVVRSLAKHRPRRFYVLNTTASALGPLQDAARALAADGVLLRYTDPEARLDGAIRGVQQQVRGSHADEIETSMMLYVDPSAVDMRKAVRHYGPPDRPSPSGVWGDATLATVEKGRILVDALVAAILEDIETLRRASLPVPALAPAPEPPVSRAISERVSPAKAPASCTAGDEREIRAIGPVFTLAWTNQDAPRLARLWAGDGDMVHPDGMAERSPNVIRQNRAQLFARREYARSRHPLTIGAVRCLSNEIAVVDGKWELRGVTDAKGQPVPTVSGLLTLVVKKGEQGWAIEAYRYTINPRPEP